MRFHVAFGCWCSHPLHENALPATPYGKLLSRPSKSDGLETPVKKPVDTALHKILVIGTFQNMS
jgi:hypothetical protein